MKRERKRTLIELLDTLEPIEDEFPPIEDPPPEPVEFDFEEESDTDAECDRPIRSPSSRRKPGPILGPMSSIQRHLWQTATAFRKAIEEADRTQWEDYLRDFPRGTCGPVSELLGRYLQEVLGRQPLYICGERHSPDFQTHAWLVCDGLVIDITADQFGEPPVIVARQSPWHDEWEQEQGRPPIITADQWPHYPSRAWAKILARLGKGSLRDTGQGS